MRGEGSQEHKEAAWFLVPVAPKTKSVLRFDINTYHLERRPSSSLSLLRTYNTC